jgi:hypothetical protein
MVVEKKMVVDKAAPPPKPEGSKNPPRRNGEDISAVSF